jgi:tripartite-type tricarboxylate transporter receptor subunit TctC
MILIPDRAPSAPSERRESGGHASRRRRRLATAVIGVLVWPVTLVCAQPTRVAYPTEPVRIVVGFPAGGGIDSVARVLAPKLSAVLQQPVIIENKPGANGSIALQQVAQSKADGHTIFFGTTGSLSVNPVFIKPAPVDMDKDFAPVTQLCSVDMVVLTGPSSPFKDLAGLLRHARNGSNVSFASSGIGSLPHLAAQMLSDRAQLHATHVVFKGSAPALTDVIGGHVDFVIDAVGVVMPHVRTGKVHALATTSGRRLAALPNVPAVAETIPGFDVPNWYGAVVRAGTPKETIRTLQSAIANAMREPDVQQRFMELGAVPVGSTPEAFGAYMKAESVRWGHVIREAKIRPE